MKREKITLDESKYFWLRSWLRAFFYYRPLVKYIIMILSLLFIISGVYIYVKYGKTPIDYLRGYEMIFILLVIGILGIIIGIVGEAQKNTAIRTKVLEIQNSGFIATGHLLFNETNREIKHVAMDKECLSIGTFSYDEVDSVAFVIEPKELNARIKRDKSYSLGGALVGGLGGLLVGAFIDSVFGSLKAPKLKRSYNFKLTFSLRLSNGEELSTTPISDSFGYDMTEREFQDRVKNIFQAMEKHINIMKRCFHDKVSAK